MVRTHQVYNARKTQQLTPRSDVPLTVALSSELIHQHMVILRLPGGPAAKHLKVGDKMCPTLLLLASLEHEHVIVDEVDIVEVNTVLDACEVLFTQVIWWEWDPVARRHQVVAWRMCQYYDVIPRCEGPRYVSRWRDRDGRLRQVRARSLLQSHTTYDVELAERDILPPARRRGLKHGRRSRCRVAA